MASPDRWILRPSYSFLDIRLQPTAGGTDMFDAQRLEGQSPRHQFSLRSSLDLSQKWEADFWMRYVDELSSIGTSAYLTADARLAWRPTRNLELADPRLNFPRPAGHAKVGLKKFRCWG